MKDRAHVLAIRRPAALLALALLAAPAQAQTGLWVGRVTLDRVSPLVSGTCSDTTARTSISCAAAGGAWTPPARPAGELPATPAELTLTVLLHQDGDGQVRLLKSFIQMARRLDPVPCGASCPCETEAATTCDPSHHVFVTDDARIHLYDGVTLRDGESVGRRVSAVGYDFSPIVPGTSENGTALDCRSGDRIAGTGEVVCVLTLRHDHPTNPFLHRYHPDHDNLASDFETPRREAKTVERTIRFSFSPDFPPGSEAPREPPPGWGIYVLGGTYGEEIKGLYRNSVKAGGEYRPAAGVESSGAVYVEGVFSLQRVSDRGFLNE